MKHLSNVSSVEVDDASEGQRVDNFLMRVCKGVPRSHVYRILRTGQVRVNSRRVDATYRLQPGDRVRIPPMRLAQRAHKTAPPRDLPVVYEDDALLIVTSRPAPRCTAAAASASGSSSRCAQRGRSSSCWSLRIASIARPPDC